MCCNLVLSPTLSAQAVNASKRQLVMLCNRKCGVLPQEHVDSTRGSRGLVQGHWLVFSKTDRVLTNRHKATNVLFIKQLVSIYKQPMFRRGNVCCLSPGFRTTIPWGVSPLPSLSPGANVCQAHYPLTHMLTHSYL